MNMNCDDMRREIEKMSKKLEKIYSMEKKFPQGELLCAKNRKHYKWYVKNEEGTFYLPKHKRELAEKLALKKYYEYQKEELENELAACNTYIRKMVLREGKAEKLLEHPEYGRLLEKYFVPVKEELWKWQNAPYEKCKKHEEDLIIKGTQGKMVRSKSEAIIDVMLYKNRIPFRYEEKLLLEGIPFYPDFTIRHPITGDFFYWEHFGMMDDEDYVNHAYDKLKVYCKNGIIPSINLITTYESKKNPLCAEKVEMIIQEYFLK